MASMDSVVSMVSVVSMDSVVSMVSVVSVVSMVSMVSVVSMVYVVSMVSMVSMFFVHQLVGEYIKLLPIHCTGRGVSKSDRGVLFSSPLKLFT